MASITHKFIENEIKKKRLNKSEFLDNGFGLRISKKNEITFFILGRQKHSSKLIKMDVPKQAHIITDHEGCLKTSLPYIKHEAKNLLLQLKDGIDPRVQIQEEALNRTPTMQEFSVEYIQNYLQNMSKEKQSQRKRYLKYFILPLIGYYPLNQITIKHVSNIHATASKKQDVSIISDDKRAGTTRKIGGQVTANQVIDCLSTILNTAQSLGLDASNPCPLFKNRHTEYARERVASDNELSAIAEILNNPPIYEAPETNSGKRRGSMDIQNAYILEACFIIKIALLAGPRKGEILNTKVSDIDFDKKLWKKRDTKAIKMSRARRKKRTQDFPISQVLIQTVNEWLALRDNLPRFSEWKSNGITLEYLFPHRFDPSKPRSGLRKAFNTVIDGEIIDKKTGEVIGCIGAGVKDLTMHDLRRTAITKLIEKGHSATTVSRLAGHTNLNTTEKHYNMQSPESIRSTVEDLGNIIKFKKNS